QTPPSPDTCSLSLDDALPIWLGQRKSTGAPFGRSCANTISTLRLTARRQVSKSTLPERPRCIPGRWQAVSLRVMPHRPSDLKHPDRKSTRLNSSHVKNSYAVF